MATNDRVLWGVGTSRTLRAHWALLHLGLPYRSEAIRTRSPEAQSGRYQALNAAGKVPTLQDGALTVSESAAIVTYLGETYDGDQAPLVPRTPAARARYFEWMSFITMELDATSLYVLRRHYGLPEIYGDAPQANTVAREYFTRMAMVAADRLPDRPQALLLGDSLSGVDILMMTCLEWAVGYHLNLPPRLAAYRDTVAAMPIYQKAREVNTP